MNGSGGTIDTYAAFGTATSTYTAPLNGLYLTFPTITYASNGTGARYAGLSVTSGTVTTAMPSDLWPIPNGGYRSPGPRPARTTVRHGPTAVPHAGSPNRNVYRTNSHLRVRQRRISVRVGKTAS